MALTIKRFIDLTAAVVLLLLCAPVMLLSALIVRIFLGAPIFFTQTRIGLNEQPFTLIKFRTMKQGSSADAERMTRAGNFLRQSSLDELPQLINILRGDMSFIGPRPLLPEYLRYYTPAERARHRVRPGITGLAQVRGRNALSWDDRLALDIHYVTHGSLALDLRIALETIRAVLFPRGITAQGHVSMPRLDECRKHSV